VPGDRYTNSWFRRQTQYNDSGQVVAFTTGATAPELMSVEGVSSIALGYSARRLMTSVKGGYGTLIERTSYEVDGGIGTIRYGDVAHTQANWTYDDNRRLKTASVERVAPTLWSSGAPAYSPPGPLDPPTTQRVITPFNYGYDASGLLNRVLDMRSANEWPTGAKPVTLGFDNDLLSRLRGATMCAHLLMRPSLFQPPPPPFRPPRSRTGQASKHLPSTRGATSSGPTTTRRRITTVRSVSSCADLRMPVPINSSLQLSAP
jgi:hypothetical protein